MSGILRRLAARAIGAPPAVRPVLAWPGAPVETPAPAPGSAPEPEVAHEVAPRSQSRARPERAAPGTVSRFPPPPSLPAAAIEPEAGDAPEPRPHPSRLPAFEPGSAPREASPAPAQHPIEERIELPAPPRAAHDAIPDAPTLLPPRPVDRTRPAPAIAAAAAARTAPARRPAVDEPTEVHVTIGRIEVTAVHEAPVPRREPARARKPKSLEEHLALRQGRRG